MKNHLGKPGFKHNAVGELIDVYIKQGVPISELSKVVNFFSPNIFEKFSKVDIGSLFYLFPSAIKHGCDINKIYDTLNPKILDRFNCKDFMFFFFAGDLDAASIKQNIDIISHFSDEALDAMDSSVLTDLTNCVKLDKAKSLKIINELNRLKPNILRRLSGSHMNGVHVEFMHISSMFHFPDDSKKTFGANIDFLNSLDKKVINYINPCVIRHFLSDTDPLPAKTQKFLSSIDLHTLLSMDFSDIESSAFVRNRMKFKVNKGLSLQYLHKYDFDEINYKQALEDYKYLKNMVIEHPLRFYSGDPVSEEVARENLVRDFDAIKLPILLLLRLTDRETAQSMLSQRMTAFLEYICSNYAFVSNAETVSRAIKCKKPDGSFFTPAEKVEIHNNLASVFTSLKHDKSSDIKSSIDKMLDEGVFDLHKIQKYLQNRVRLTFLKSKSSPLVAQHDSVEWDKNHLSNLFKAYYSKRVARNKLVDVVEMSYDKRGFLAAITDESGVYGQKNAIVKQFLSQAGVDYNKWLSPSKDDYLKVDIASNDAVEINELCSVFAKSVEKLLKTKASVVVQKRYPDNVSNGEFVIPEEIMASKTRLVAFMSKFIKDMSPIWERSAANSSSQDLKVANTAKHVLNIKKNLEAFSDLVSKVAVEKKMNRLSLTIKMWDRVPQKDIFQGNYSKCCIAMGENNAFAVPEYLTNTTFNMIELVNNKTGKPIGNALVFLAKDASGKPIFVIDNVEIPATAESSPSFNMKLRDAIFTYAKRVAKEIAPNQDMKIYLGKNRNEIPVAGMKLVKSEVHLPARFNFHKSYLDVFGGIVRSDRLPNKVQLCAVD